MGLAEKRAIAEYQEKVFPGIQKEIQTLVGAPLAMDVRWDTMASPGYADSYKEFFGKVYFTPLIQAIKAVASDAMGKEAVKKELKKIVIDGSGGYSSSNFTFENGELLIKHESHSNVDDIKERAEAIQRLLEEKL